MKNNKRKKKVKLIYKIIVYLLFLVSMLFVVGLMCLNVLTMKLFMIVVGVIIFIDFLFWLFIIKSKKKKISSALAFIFIVIFSLGSFYLFKTNGLFSGMLSHYKIYNYSVVVCDESEYMNIEDIDGLALGYLKSDSEEVDKSIQHINKKINPEYIEYEDVNKMVNGLLNEKVESILVEDSYLNMVKEDNSEFTSSTRVIYTFKVRIKIDDFSKDVNVTKDTFSVFISGIDTYGSVDSVSRSDVNMVVTVNPKTKQILLTSIPRDYYVALHGVSGYKDKLTHAGLYGIDMSVKTVEDLLDIEINYYVKINFTSVIDIVDALGGVDVYSDYTFTSIDGYHYTAGYNKVNGEEALSFARERKAFSAGDNQRIKNQQALIQAALKKCLSKEIIYKYNKLLDSLDGSFVTNMASERIASLIKMQIRDMSSWTITSNSLKGLDGYNYTYSYSSQKLYVMEADQVSVEDAYNLIMAVYNGDILENSYDENTGESHIVTRPSYNSSSSNKTSKDDKEETTSLVITSQTDEEDIEKEIIDADITSGSISDEDVPPVADDSSQVEDSNNDNEVMDDTVEDNDNIDDSIIDEENRNIEEEKEDDLS